MKLAIATLFVCAAFGQDTEKVFHFANTASPQGFQEIANAIRAIAEVRQLSVAAESKVLAVRGTKDQVSMAEWLFRELDKSAAPATSERREYAVSGSASELVRIFYVTSAPNPQAVQEIVNAVRSISEVQRIMVCNASKAIAARGTTAQITLADWLIAALDKPAGGAPPAVGQTLTAPEYRMRDGSPSAAKVFYPVHLLSPMQRQEGVNMIRTIAELQRAVACNAPEAIVVRGSAGQVALAAWLLDEIAKPSGSEAPALEPAMADTNSGVTRIFHLANAATPQALQQTADMLRQTAGIRRVTFYIEGQAIALRGSADQVATAARLIREVDMPR